MIGLFGFPEIVHSFGRVARNVLNIEKFNQRDGWAVLKRNKLNIVRSALLGMSMGAIPGVGEDTGGWLAYWSEKKVYKSDKWGKGEINGIVSAEAGNNAAVGGAIIPVLSLAIPGSAPAAVLLAAFWMHGYRPGPLLMSETPEFLYLVVVSMMFASLVMVLIANNMAKITVKVLQVDQRILMPIVFVCCVIGAFVVNNRLFDIKLMFVFGLLGVAMSYMHYPSAPFLLGVVMGNMADENLRRALMLSDGSILPFFTRPICIFFLLFIAVLVVQQLPCYPALKEKLFGKKKEA
jgi:putative tricarboxylic transport membrane protein